MRQERFESRRTSSPARHVQGIEQGLAGLRVTIALPYDGDNSKHQVVASGFIRKDA